MVRSERGSALVEFALVAPLLIFLLLSIMAVGMVINAKIVVAGAAREAGRSWAIEQSDQRARQRAAEAITGGGLPTQSRGAVLFDPNRDVVFERRDAYVAATVTYRQPTFVPLLAWLLDPDTPRDGRLTLRSQALFRVER